MVLQYRKGKGKWKDYPGKDKVEGDISDYRFRLLSEDKSRVLKEEGAYDEVMKRFRQIEFFKHRG